MTRAYVGLGSNLGDRAHCSGARSSMLAAEPEVEVVAVSSIRETDPVGYADQPRFLNAAAALETELDPRGAPRASCSAIERELGRTRDGPRFGPRTIDLDLLLYGDEVVDEPGLDRSASSAARARVRRSSRSPSSTRSSTCPGGAAVADLLRGLQSSVMSHLDELDEYEAELELRLKREYTAVFGALPLLRAHAGRDLPLQQARPRATCSAADYPFFQVKMEDVWVWDKNRPTRIIPRAEVFTSGDVTVEELRGEGEEPTLTAEALAERIGEALGSTTTRSAPRRSASWPVLLAVDVGNTQTVFGLFDGDAR